MNKINCWKCEWVKHPHYDDYDNLSPICTCPYMEMAKNDGDYYNSNYKCRFFLKEIPFWNKLIKIFT